MKIFTQIETARMALRRLTENENAKKAAVLLGMVVNLANQKVKELRLQAKPGSDAALVGADDAMMVKIVQDMVKGLQDACTEYGKGTSAEAKAKLKETEGEIGVLKAFLPKQLTREELVEAIGAAIATLPEGQRTMKDIGVVNAVLKNNYSGLYDPKATSALVKEQLGL